MSQEKVSAGAPAGAEAPAEIPERWSAARKAEVVLRVLRGEAIDAVSRETQVPVPEVEGPPQSAGPAPRAGASRVSAGGRADQSEDSDFRGDPE